jgi:hypothetical protein
MFGATKNRLYQCISVREYSARSGCGLVAEQKGAAVENMYRMGKKLIARRKSWLHDSPYGVRGVAFSVVKVDPSSSRPSHLQRMNTISAVGNSKFKVL